MLEPRGKEAVFSDDRGYLLIADSALLVPYSLLDHLALLLVSVGLVGTFASPALPIERVARMGSILAFVAVGSEGMT